MKAVTHLEKVITGEVSAVTHIEKVIAGETSAVTYTEKVITGEATPITHLQRVIAGVESPVTHLEHVWAGSSPEPTEHEYTGAVPYTFTANGSPLISWRISGNTVQSGTPTPQNPAMPDGCGNMTGNLLNLNLFAEKYEGKITFGNGVFDVSTASQDMYTTGISVDIPANTTFSCENITKENQSLRGRIKFVFDDNSSQDVLITLSDGTTAQNPVVSFAKAIIAIRLDWSTFNGGFSFKLAMLNTGSTALPYEPYGYKIPISSAGQTTPVYLGEVQTTRKIKKLVLTGEEMWQKSNAYQGSFYAQIITGILSETYTAYCSHLAFSILSQYAKGKFCFNGGIIKNCNLWFNQFDSSTTVDELKAYLAAQYSAGTPVTVWYVLATPETAVVNEPLRKIGEYADTLSMEQAGVSIPTNNGSTTVDVETTLKPSEVYIKYKGV